MLTDNGIFSVQQMANLANEALICLRLLPSDTAVLSEVGWVWADLQNAITHDPTGTIVKLLASLRALQDRDTVAVQLFGSGLAGTILLLAGAFALATPETLAAVTDARYLTKQDDMIDAICYRQYGATAAYTEAVLAVNPGLAEQCPFLPVGVTVALPVFPQPQVQSPVALGIATH